MNQSPTSNNLAATYNAHIAGHKNLNSKKKKKKVLKQNKKDNKANMITNMILDQLNEIRPSLIARKPKKRSPGLGSS
jgi:hypothetical protein